MSEAPVTPPGGGVSPRFRDTPLPMRGYLSVVSAAAVVLPLLLSGLGVQDPAHPALLTVTVLVVISVLNVEIGRVLAGGLSEEHQPHKALSAWAFASALLLPTPWLLLVVPVTYAHARWRGLRLPLWKWVGSAAFLVLSGLVAGLTAHAVFGERTNWLQGDAGLGLVAVLAAATAFLALETLLFTGSALLNHAEDEVWLRQTLRSPAFYLTETGVLLIGGLLSAVWTAGAWFVLLFLPIYTLAQRAALHEPLRVRAEASARLEATNADLERANQFKIDLMGMLGHEIGNPVTSVVGYAQVGAEALDEGDLATARRSLGIVEGNAERIRLVLHDILTMVSSDRGALVARPESCRLEPHLRSAVVAHPRSTTPEVDCEPELTVLAQPGHLDQILANLLSNADKYAGGATRVAATLDASGTVRVTVADAGPGVPGELRAHLFQRFTRGADTAERVMGTGLGLFITRELARANGGDVHHHDGPGCGSVFELTLPRGE